MANFSGADMRCPKCNRYLPDRCTCNGPSIEERRNGSLAMDELNLQAERAALVEYLMLNFSIGEAEADFHARTMPIRRAAPVAQLDADLPPLPRVITEETAKQYMEESLWAFIECAGNYPSIKPDARVWPHVMAYMPPQSSDTLLSEILTLATQGMCHGLLADDYCSQIVAKIKGGA